MQISTCNFQSSTFSCTLDFSGPSTETQNSLSESTCKPCSSVRPQREFIFIPYACIQPLWDIASWSRVSSPSNPSTSKHLSSSGMNNYRLSQHNLYTYLRRQDKDICSPVKHFKFQNCGLASSAPSSWDTQWLIQLTMLPSPVGHKVVLFKLSWSSATLVPLPVLVPGSW